MQPPRGFKAGTPALVIQHPNHYAFAPLHYSATLASAFMFLWMLHDLCQSNNTPMLPSILSLFLQNTGKH